MPILSACRGARWSIGKGRAIAGLVLLGITLYLARGVTGTVLYENLEAFLPTLPDREQEYSRAFRAVVEEDVERGLQVAQELGAPVFLHFTGYQ